MNKFLIRLLVVSWLLAVIMMLIEKKRGGVSVEMLQIWAKYNGMMQIGGDT